MRTDDLTLDLDLRLERDEEREPTIPRRARRDTARIGEATRRTADPDADTIVVDVDGLTSSRRGLR